MIVGAEFLTSGSLPPVLIIGSGPAGVSLAVGLSELGIGAIVLEAGPEDWSDPSQDRYAGEVFGDGYFPLDSARLRYLGGSSNHWAGWCRPLDEKDFERREDVPHTGWPIKKDDLAPFLQPACDILEVTPPEDNVLSDDLVEVGFSLSPPVRFGEKYREFFEKAPDTHLVLSCSVESLDARDGRITALNLLAGDSAVRIDAPETVVLCCGGIENSRLLLWSNVTSAQRVVANDATLGRFWMEHPHASLGDVAVSRNFDRVPLDGGEIRVAPRKDSMLRHGIMNGALRFYRVYQEESRATDLAKRAICRTEPLSSRFLSLAGRQVQCTSRIAIAWEQAPVAENRVSLSATARDDHGIPRPELHWRKSAIDYRTSKVILELFGKYLLQTGRGRVRAEPFVIAEGGYPTSEGGYHHMGGTRMSSGASNGVVDANLRIHDLSNGYVLGSSVFPTGGHANPTLTIVQLALRLAKHLAARI